VAKRLNGLSGLMPLGVEVALGPGDFVFDGDPATARKKGTPTLGQFFRPSPTDDL